MSKQYSREATTTRAQNMKLFLVFMAGKWEHDKAINSAVPLCSYPIKCKRPSNKENLIRANLINQITYDYREYKVSPALNILLSYIFTSCQYTP